MWLDEGNGRGLEEIRNLNKHPWMQDLFEEDSEGGKSHESSETNFQQSAVVEWLDGVVHQQDIPYEGP